MSEYYTWRIFGDGIYTRKTIVSKSGEQQSGRDATVTMSVYSAQKMDDLEGLLMVCRPVNDLESMPQDHLKLEAVVSMVLN